MNKINKKILIVEDDEDFVFILEKKFTDEGFSIITAKDGQEGVAMAQKERPDLILSDMLMPKMDGMAMAKKIQEQNPGILIIFLTNLKDADRAGDAKKPDAFDYLIKSDMRIDDIILKVKMKLGIE